MLIQLLNSCVCEVKTLQARLEGSVGGPYDSDHLHFLVVMLFLFGPTQDCDSDGAWMYLLGC